MQGETKLKAPRAYMRPNGDFDFANKKLPKES